MEMNRRLVAEIVLGIIAVLAVLSAIYNFRKAPVTVTRDRYTEVPKEKAVEKIRTVTVPGPTKIVTIEKPVIAEKLDMGIDFAEDPEKQAIANADLPPSKAGYSAVAVIDMADGHTVIQAKEKPLPLFGFPSEKEIGLRYGLRSNGLQGGNVYGKWTFLRVGNLYLGAYGEIDTRPEAKAMLDLSYRF
jgi:hypothetical protein